MAKIDVVFNDSTNETGVVEQQAKQNNQTNTNSNKAGSYLIGQAAVQLGKRALSYASGQIGNITGNYILQNNIDNALTLVGYAGQIGVGFASGGPVGGAVSIIAVAGQIGVSATNYEIDRTKANAQAQFLMQQRGGLLNGNSR